MTTAAGVPVAFLTAWYGLHTLAGLRAGQRVLIHAAAGGVGMAAVQLALRCGAEVFATAGSDAKRELLRAMGVQHVMDSRSLRFVEQIRAATGGAGVHVVLNSLAGEFLTASLSALGNGGCFLELGKRDLPSAQELSAKRPDIRFIAFDLGTEALEGRVDLRAMMERVLEGFSDGSLRPLPVKTFPLGEFNDAFRFMAQARHVGKIVLEAPDGAAAGVGHFRVRPNATYWIVGGLGAIGLETARWLVRLGASHIVLTGRSAQNAAAVASIEALQREGASVNVLLADAADAQAMQAICKRIEAELPPLRGVVHAAGVLHDGVLANQRWRDAAEVLRSKAHGAWVLHELTRNLTLDFFILYSAAGVLLGAAGQGLYPAANAQLDALAHARRALGLPAVSVAWGRWANAGMAARLAASGTDMWQSRGLLPIAADEAFVWLERVLDDGAASHVAIMPVRWQQFMAHLPAGMDPDFFQEVMPAPKVAQASAAVSAGHGIAERLRALPLGQRRASMIAFLAQRTLHVLGLDSSTSVDPRSALKDIGLDSLMAVELRNDLIRAVKRSLPATLLFDFPTLNALGEHLLRLLEIEADLARPGPATARDAAKEIAALSEDEAEDLLLKELERGG